MEEKSVKKLCLQVEAAYEGLRIDKYLAEVMTDYSRSFLQKQLKDKNVTVNGCPVKASYKVAEEEEIAVAIPASREPDILPQNIPLDILYEDEQLLVVNKPKGMVVHPSAGHYSDTLVNALMFHCKGQLSGINGVLRPGIVHRIDMDTTGALVVCKTDLAHQSLAAQLKEHSITRRYRAIVHGNLKESQGTVEGTIGRHPVERKKMAANVTKGKRAVTHYRVLEQLKGYTYVECQLETGRTHQIRVHMSSIGHPLLGDVVYGPKKCPFPSLMGQTLHAMVLGFLHPVTGEYLEFQAPLPEYFEALLKKLR
ncbi:MAG TPA: RluA family pseudouridine synthase [Candidatus Blautia pullicola]|uniref:Pseudouridine synthase n=1 Tax=Candidatus Blautia pullicola TaxID=2838498 RepID=A0A9D2JU54_9FIRM|nr:RluA family pseudouridine synthase [Candidatus Blautia pullicola]